MQVKAPTSDIDLYDDVTLTDPYPAFRELRDLGPVVWMERLGAWALPRYDQVRDALQQWETFSSASGVGVSRRLNAERSSGVLASDPPEHTRLRRILHDQLSPKALRSWESRLTEMAESLLDRLVRKQRFDAVADLAATYTEDCIIDLVGLPQDRREELRPNADAGFNPFGPENERALRSLPLYDRLVDYTRNVSAPPNLCPGRNADTIYRLASEGVIPKSRCPGLILAYTFAGMDTTVNGIGTAVWLFAQHPDQWDLVRDDPSLIPSAFNEVLRIESPVQTFARTVTAPTTVEGLPFVEGDLVLMMFASANRDERKYADPDRFDVTRNPTDHLAFGRGIHACVGMTFARLEAHAVLRALAARVRRFELVGEQRHLNNSLRGFGSLDIKVET